MNIDGGIFLGHCWFYCEHHKLLYFVFVLAVFMNSIGFLSVLRLNTTAF
jgi:hypothetical protein